MDYTQLAPEEILTKTVEALQTNGFETIIVENREEAKQEILKRIPLGSEVMTMSSETLRTLGITQEIDESGRYISVRKELETMTNPQKLEKNRLGTAPEYTVGSIQAITEDGQILIASNTGSQLPAYAYGSPFVMWVVGTHKIVKNFEEGLKRIYEHSLPLENQRAQKSYGVESGVNKLLVINKETKPGRITLILLKEQVGF